MIRRFFSTVNNITFIGGGKMTNAMVNGLLKSGRYNSNQITISDRNHDKNQYFKDKWNIKTEKNNYTASKDSDIIILAVKPQSLSNLFTNINGIQNKILISVIAGIPVQVFKSNLKNNKIVRVMPNTPCMIQKGMSTWITSDLNDEEKEIVKNILNSFGKEIYVENENTIDISTAISGTGPMYTYLLVESMIDAGIHMGLSREKTKKLVYQTVLGSIEYMIDSDIHPAILRNDITSPGGTSANALYILEKEGFRNTISEAIWSAYKKSLDIRNNKDI